MLRIHLEFWLLFFSVCARQRRNDALYNDEDEILLFSPVSCRVTTVLIFQKLNCRFL